METDTLPPHAPLDLQLLIKIQDGDVEGVKDLMQQGAPLTPDSLGTGPLHWACQLNHIDIAELFLKAGISQDSRNKAGRTPLHCTAQYGHVAVLKLLLSYGVDVNATDMLWMSPLHWAAESGNKECVRLLLEHGADPCATNKFDKTADQIAFEKDCLDITLLIQEYAESPLRQVRQKESKERQKQIAMTHRAVLELERVTKQQVARAEANPKEVRQVRTLKLSQMRVVSPLQTTPQVRVVSPLQTKPQVRAVSLLKTAPQMRVVSPLQTAPQMRVVSLLQTAPHRVGSPLQTTSPKIGNKSNLGFSMKKNTTVNKINNTNQLTMDTCTEPGKMALTVKEQPSPLTGKVIKVLPEMLCGKKVFKISPQDLIKLKNEKRIIITTEKTLKPSIFITAPHRVGSPLQTTSPKIGNKSNLGFSMKKNTTVNKINNTNQLTMDTCTEPGKMALTVKEQPSPLTGKVIKVLPEMLCGKKVFKISPQDLIKLKNEKRIIITTEKTLKPSIFINKSLPVAPPDKRRVEVMEKKMVVNNKPQLMSSVTVEKTAEESEVERLKRELEESRRQVRELQEQLSRKEKKEEEEHQWMLDLLKDDVDKNL